MVDTFTVVNFLYNADAQYGAIVVGAMTDGNASKLPAILFEPIRRLGVDYQFVKAAKTVAERQARVTPSMLIFRWLKG